MREIKFKAYIPKYESVVDVDVIDFSDKEPWIACPYDQGFNKDKETGESDCVFKIAEVTLLQNTGLKDKNGVEIYEGDICYVLDDIGAPKEYGDKWDRIEVEFTPACLNFFTDKCEDKHVEVIGNIYQNSELLV